MMSLHKKYAGSLGFMLNFTSCASAADLYSQKPAAKQKIQ